ncbi:MAG: carboxymuconolactone decarboxylase family protein [Chromatiaceae bacterium]
MKPINTLIPAAALAFFATTAWPDEPPSFYKNTYPEHALKSRLEAEAVLTGEGAKLDAKTRELVALGVAAQIPCAYCVYYHAKAARGEGATEAEVREAVATAAHVRHWSTVLNGLGYDFDSFKVEVDALMSSE